MQCQDVTSWIGTDVECSTLLHNALSHGRIPETVNNQGVTNDAMSELYGGAKKYQKLHHNVLCGCV